MVGPCRRQRPWPWRCLRTDALCGVGLELSEHVGVWDMLIRISFISWAVIIAAVGAIIGLI
jgi:hypothetical protein